jgi:uncharacterized protein DUF3574
VIRASGCPVAGARLVGAVLLIAGAAACNPPVHAQGGSVARVFPSVCPPAAGVRTRPPVPGAGRTASGKRSLGEAFLRTELYFGSERRDLPGVSLAEFEQFLDAVVAPCFPDGLTLLTGKGQFRESDGRVVREMSFVLLLFYPAAARQESSERIDAIRDAYKESFSQQSVLRVDDPDPVRVGF